MDFIKKRDFISKKNKVFLAQNDNDVFVVKEFFSKESLLDEVNVHNMIFNKLSTPRILEIDENIVFYEYIKGETFLALLENENLNEEKIILLLKWLFEFYNITKLILKDAHLRNFIYNENKVYGIDFETVKQGEIKEDIANLVVFILTYNPSFTNYKILTAKILLKNAIKLFSLDKNELKEEIIKQSKIIEKRRNIVFLKDDEWDIILKNIL